MIVQILLGVTIAAVSATQASATLVGNVRKFDLMQASI